MCSPPAIFRGSSFATVASESRLAAPPLTVSGQLRVGLTGVAADELLFALPACQLLGLPLKARVIAHYESHHQRLVRGGELKVRVLNSLNASSTSISRVTFICPRPSSQSNLDDAELLLLVAAETTTALLSFLQNPSSGVFNDAASVGDGYGAFRIRMQRETLAHLTTFIRSGHFSLVRDIPITAARKALQTWSSAAQVDWPTYGLSDDAPSYYGGTVSAKDRGALLCAFFFELMYSIRVVGDLARSPEATAGAAAVAAQK